MGDEYVLETRGVRKVFPGVVALDGISLKFRPGTVHSLMGENGAGKSTLMKILSGMYKATEGTMLYKGVETVFEGPVEAIRLGIAMIHQELSPVPHRSVMENIWLGREPLIRGTPFVDHRKMQEATQKLLDDLELSIDPRIEMAKLTVAKMQMVEIAKAVSYNSEVLIMDEPTSSLTKGEVEQLFRIIRRLRERGKAIIYISHKMDEIFEISVPIVKDKSGNGNHGLIHGAPELGADDQGRTTLVLDGKRDYVEIPDKGGYRVSEAATGMVWANLPGAGTTKGGLVELVEPYSDGKGIPADHNPLMFKGINLGWGTPYLFRIAVRETGKVTYGLCFEDDNGEFQWNDSSDPKAGIKKNTWVQYTSAFDFQTGGDSYQNGYRSAGVEKPAFGNAPVRNWEGVPMRIGHGFKNTVLQKRGRGLYYTMLPGSISQVRFYTSKISAAENDAIRANPTIAHESAKNLRIWLDFEPANLVTKGTHTTEWVEVADRPNVLRYKADFAGKAKVVTTVQTSDDQKKVKQSRRFTLSSGTQAVDLKALGKGRYVRIVTELQSDLNQTASSVPVVHEYLLEAGTSKRWNTLVDWMRGTFSQAAGYHSGDNYRNHAVDFADYSGEASAPDKL